jgi:hypothetical protein
LQRSNQFGAKALLLLGLNAEIQDRLELVESLQERIPPIRGESLHRSSSRIPIGLVGECFLWPLEGIERWSFGTRAKP